ncbi:putative ankyrin repeat protein RF_0381 isoform X1 [Saccostrea cucullata]|uniref:putative ankyrin repeat protein RF_0381 isoform X1 n=1 Tax=Saccostrea cuccullata TaxID=36930 RepID=UPI002ED1CC28
MNAFPVTIIFSCVLQDQECLVIDRQNKCFEAAASCRKLATNSTTVGRIMLTASSPIIVIFIICFICVRYMYRRKCVSYKNPEARYLFHDNDGEISIHDAAWNGDMDLLKLLIEKGLNIKSTKDDGKTVVHACCGNGKLEVCKYLVKTYPSLVHVTDSRDRNVLHDAALSGDIDMFMFLIRKGLDVNNKSNDGKTVLHACCYNGKIKLCKYLVKTYPYLLDITDNNGENVLHAAAIGGNIDLFILLVGKGIDIRSKTNDGKNVLHLCCRNGKMDMCRYLVNTYPYLLNVIDKNGGNVLHDAAWGGNINVLKFLLKDPKGLKVDIKSKDGKSILHQCCLNGKLDMCKYLAETYHWLINDIDKYGETVLHAAAWGGNIELLKFLIQYGFDINDKRHDGKTLLHLCCMNRQMEMCRYIVSNYTDLVEVIDDYGQNALHEKVWGGGIVGSPKGLVRKRAKYSSHNE